MGKADMFLRLEGQRTGVVKGESNVAEHPEEIEVEDFSWGMTGGTYGGAGGGNKGALNELQISKGTDRATTQLMSVLRNNEVVKKAVLSIRKAGSNPPIDYLVITVQNGRLTSHTIGCRAPGQSELVETFSIAFDEIEVAYAPQEGTGSAAASLTFNTTVHNG